MMNHPHHSMKRTICWECLWFVCITLSFVIAINIQDWAYHAFQMNREVLAWGVIGSSTLIAWGFFSLYKCHVSNMMKIIQMVMMIPAISIIIGIVLIWFMEI